MSNYKKNLNILRSTLKEKIKNKKVSLRNTIITKKLIGLTFHIHNGKTFKFLNLKKEMVGFKFGEFIKTRVTYNINKKKKKKKK